MNHDETVKIEGIVNMEMWCLREWKWRLSEVKLE